MVIVEKIQQISFKNAYENNANCLRWFPFLQVCDSESW